MRSFDSADYQALFSELREVIVYGDETTRDRDICRVLTPLLVRDAIDGDTVFDINRQTGDARAFIGDAFVIEQAKIEPFAHSYRITIRAKASDGAVVYTFVGRLSAMQPTLLVETATITPNSRLTIHS